MPPSSWRSTSWGLIAMPDVGDRRRLAARARARCRGRPRPRRRRCRSPRTPAPRRTSPALGRDLAAPDQLAAREAEVLDEQRRVASPRRARRVPAISTSFRADVRGGALHGEARDRRRAARAGRAVVRREARVGAAHASRARASSRAPPRRSARTRCARPGPSSVVPDEHGHLAVGLHAHDRASRRGGRPPRAGRPRRRGRCSGPSARPSRRRAAAFSTSPMMSASSGLPPARTSSPRRAQVGLAHRERIEPAAARRARRSAARRSTAGASRRTRGRSRTGAVFVYTQEASTR